jgi:hypothetical protein
MTNKKEVAQAVKKSAEDAYWLWDQMCPADANIIAAAALREAANQLQYYNFGEGVDMIVDAHSLYEVADELEAKNETL